MSAAAGQEEELIQDASAQPNVVRAVSLAQAALEAETAGLSKREIYQRVEDYRSEWERAWAQPDQPSRQRILDALERMFSRDKSTLRSIGVQLPEVRNDAGEYRYRVDPASYGLPELDLSPGEVLALHHIAGAVADLSGTGMGHALWALGLRSPANPVTPRTQMVQARLGSPREWERLVDFSILDFTSPITFAYTKRGGPGSQQRRVYPLRMELSGAWYVQGYDLDRADLRYFRLDRIGTTPRVLKPRELSAEERDWVVQAQQSPPWTEAELDARGISFREADTERGRAAVAQVHEAAAAPVKKLSAPVPSAASDMVQEKTERVMNMMAYLLARQGVEPRELMSLYGIGPAQLLADLLSVQQTSSSVFGDSAVGIYPEPPLNRSVFETDYLVANEPISITVPGVQAEQALRRPISLSRPGALGLLIAADMVLQRSAREARANEEEAAAGLPDKEQMDSLQAGTSRAGWGEGIPAQAGLVKDVVSVREKILGVAPTRIAEFAAKLRVRQDLTSALETELGAALAQGHPVKISYRSAEGALSERIVEPVQLVFSGHSGYLRAWCRKAQAERYFRISRILDQQTLSSESISDAAQALAEEPAGQPQVPVDDTGWDAVLRFSASVAAQADAYRPLASRSDRSSGNLTARIRFRSYLALQELVFAGGGEIEVLSPAQLRQRIYQDAVSRCHGQSPVQ